MDSSPHIPIQNPCPFCRAQGTVFVDKNHVFCKACDFDYTYCCPLCDTSLNGVPFLQDQHGDYVVCPDCNHSVHVRRIGYLLDNKLVVDHEVRCTICNGPTVHRAAMNVGHRCFFFPRCSGQADLFATAKESIVFLDFETSGLEAGKDHITEFGAVKIDEEGFEHIFESFVSVPVALEPKITQITGITDAMLENAPDLKSVMERFKAFLGNSILVSHNAEFDVPWLLVASHDTGVALPMESVICTLKWSRKLQEPHGSLGALTKKYKIQHSNAHRALADAAATKELFFIFETTKGSTRPIEPISLYQHTTDKILGRFRKPVA